MSPFDASQYGIVWEHYVSDQLEVKRILRELEKDLARIPGISTVVNARIAAIQLAIVVQFEYNGLARPKFVDEQPPEYLRVRKAIELITAQMEEASAFTASNRSTMAAGILICLLVKGEAKSWLILNRELVKGDPDGVH